MTAAAHLIHGRSRPVARRCDRDRSRIQLSRHRQYDVRSREVARLSTAAGWILIIHNNNNHSQPHPRIAVSISRSAPAQDNHMTTQTRTDAAARVFPGFQYPGWPQGNIRRLTRLSGWIGISILALMLILAFFPSAIAPYDSTERVALPLQKPNADNFLGANDLGQDLFSELIAGTRASLFTGLIVGTLAICIGT